GLLEDTAFRVLSHALDGLRADPVEHAEQIAATEGALRERVLELGAAKLRATEEEHRACPFLSRRVGGVLLGDLRLAGDAAFQELVAKRDAVVAAGPGQDREALAAVERQLRGRAGEVAAAKKAVDAFRADEDEAVRARNPFLEANEVRLVPLRFLDLSDDAHFRGHYKKWLTALGDEVMDLEVVRVFGELLQERAGVLAERLLQRCDGKLAELRERGLTPDVEASLPWDLRVAPDVLQHVLQSSGTGDGFNAAVRCMSEALLSAERGVAAELQALRVACPMCVRDVNPAVARDKTFQQLETKRQLLLRSFAEMAEIESLEAEQRRRGVELLLDADYVAVARQACEATKKRKINEMTVPEMTARWRHRLLARRSRHRVVAFLEAPDGERGTRRARSPPHRQRRTGSSAGSRSIPSFVEVPENVAIEIKEGDTLLPSSASYSRRTSRIFSRATSFAPFPAGSEGEEGLPAPGNERRRTLRLRRLRYCRGGGGLSMEAILDVDASPLAEEAAAAQAIRETHLSVDEALAASVAVAAGGLGASQQQAEAEAERQQARAEKKKRRKQVLRRRMKLRRGSGKSASQLTVSSIPDLEAGEMVEAGTEQLEEPAADRRAPARRAPKQEERAPRRQRRSASVPMLMAPVPEPEGAAQLQEEAPEAPPPPRGAWRGLPRPRDERAQSPSCVRWARRSMNDVRTHNLSVTELPPPPPPLTLPKLFPLPSEGGRGEEGVAAGALTGLPPRPPDEKRRRPKKKHAGRKALLLVTDLQEDDHGEIPDAMRDEFPWFGRRVLGSTLRSRPQELEPSPRRARTLPLRPLGSITQVAENESSSIADDVVSLPLRSRLRRRCSFDPSQIFPADRREAQELERERRLMFEALMKARPRLSRNVTVDELECDADVMASVFKYDDISQAFATQPSPLAEAYLRELFSAAVQRVIEMSTEPLQPGCSKRAAAARQWRRQELAVRAEALRSVSTGCIDPDAFSVKNPRCVPQPWAQFCTEELVQDNRLQELLNLTSAERGESILQYLLAWSRRKERESENLFSSYPFLPPLPHGVPLSELRLLEDEEFRRYAAAYSTQDRNENLQKVMCDVVERLAKQHAGLRGRERLQDISFIRLLQAACGGAASPHASLRSAPLGGGEASPSRGRSTIREERLRVQFLAQCKQDSLSLLRRLIVRIKKERTADIPLSIEDIETFRRFFEVVDVGSVGLLDRGNFVEFVMLTVCDELAMTRREVEQLAFPGLPGSRPPELVDFSDFSNFYKSLALQEVKRQDSRFCEEATPSPARSRQASPRQPSPRVSDGGPRPNSVPAVVWGATASPFILPAVRSNSAFVNATGAPLPLQQRPDPLLPQAEVARPGTLPMLRGVGTPRGQAWTRNSGIVPPKQPSEASKD
ncbi:uncharacterized protein Tco025E_06897, partial [Trypanosoma conorhini]